MNPRGVRNDTHARISAKGATPLNPRGARTDAHAQMSAAPAMALSHHPE